MDLEKQKESLLNELECFVLVSIYVLVLIK